MFLQILIMVLGAVVAIAGTAVLAYVMLQDPFESLGGLAFFSPEDMRGLARTILFLAGLVAMFVGLGAFVKSGIDLLFATGSEMALRASSIFLGIVAGIAASMLIVRVQLDESLEDIRSELRPGEKKTRGKYWIRYLASLFLLVAAVLALLYGGFGLGPFMP